MFQNLLGYQGASEAWLMQYVRPHAFYDYGFLLDCALGLIAKLYSPPEASFEYDTSPGKPKQAGSVA